MMTLSGCMPVSTKIRVASRPVSGGFCRYSVILAGWLLAVK